MKRIAIQGVSGSYHEVAAQSFFAPEEVEIVECLSFASLVDTILADASLLGVMAIENTIAGSLLANHELLRRSGLVVLGEYKLHISHAFAALPGQKIADIIEVDSHPIALMQCEEFLSTLPTAKVVEKEDTASAASAIARQRLQGHAAICSPHAAALYGLEVLKMGVETNKQNFTRFLVIGAPLYKTEVIKGVVNKASLAFSLPHTQGSLAKVLTILSFYDINLTKIQSLPIIGHQWEYRFYIDLSFDDYQRYHQSIAAIIPLTNEFKILGEYHATNDNPRP